VKRGQRGPAKSQGIGCLTAHRCAIISGAAGNRATDGELLRRGMKAVDAGGIGTNHTLTTDLNSFPRGSKTAFQEGGLFKEVTLNRGRPMSR
jgi:hypothetical protein